MFYFFVYLSKKQYERIPCSRQDKHNFKQKYKSKINKIKSKRNTVPEKEREREEDRKEQNYGRNELLVSYLKLTLITTKDNLRNANFIELLSTFLLK